MQQLLPFQAVLCHGDNSLYVGGVSSALQILGFLIDLIYEVPFLLYLKGID